MMEQTAADSGIRELMSASLMLVFNEDDPDRRAAAIQKLYSEECLVVDSEDSVSGRHLLNLKVARLRVRYPGYLYRLRGTAEAHHGLGCVRWWFGRPEALDAVTGLHVVVVRDGHICVQYAFGSKPIFPTSGPGA
jgi:hypothetical protein